MQTKDDFKRQFETDMEAREVEKWQNSNPKESFESWKLKRYVDKRIWEVIIGIIVALIVFSFLARR